MTSRFRTCITGVIVTGTFMHAIFASDVIIDLDTGGGFVVRDNTTTIERLRIEESTGNFLRNGDLFIHSFGGLYIGPNAGNLTNSANTNVGVGEFALGAVTSGGLNTAVGSRAMEKTTQGVHNAAFGDASLKSNTIGANNTALGHNALSLALNGNENTVVGSGSAISLVGGSHNTTLGSRVMRSAIGSDNIAIGRSAGDALITGDNNIYLGNPGVDNDGGQIRIGTGGVQTQTFLAGVFGNGVSGEFVVVDANGKLGSTTVSPGGSSVILAAAGAFVVQNNTQAIDRFRVDEATGDLSRNGALLLHDAGQSTNLFVGSGAGNPAATAGFNSAFGPDALSAVSTGISNAAFGTRALRFNTDGEGNTALGTEALENNTIGNSNTAIGRFALRANEDGIANVAIGVASLRNNLSGYNNIAIGQDALKTSVIGIFNTAVGTNTLFDHTGDGTTAIGAWALENNLTAPNTAIGAYALQGNQHGIKQTAVGYHAMRNISGGNPGNVDLPPSPSGNTAVGFEALRDVGSKGGNTAVGAEALRNPSGASNTAVGSGTLRGEDGVPFHGSAGQNTAVGTGAMALSAGISRYNVALGYLALQRIGNNGQPNDAGQGNIAIGWRAGWNLKEGNNNIYIGNEGPLIESSQIRIGTNGTHLAQHLAGDVTVEKSISVTSLTIRGGADIAEPFDIRSTAKVEAGMVVSIDPENAGALRLSHGAYDRTVVGIISGAGGVRPGITLTQEGSIADGAHPVAMSGRVYALADESAGGEIRPGDLLTTAERSGYAMRVTDPTRSAGAVLGKAMTARDPGTGLVLVLVTLQ